MKRKYCVNDEFNLSARKGVFIYDNITSWEKLQENPLPDYQHACKV